MKYQAATLLLAGLATAAPVAQDVPPTSNEGLRAGGSIVSGVGKGIQDSAIPGANSIASILNGLGSGLSNPQGATKRQIQPAHPPPAAHPPPTAADMERGSSILKGLGSGLKGSFPGSDAVASILSGLSGGLHEGSKNPPSAPKTTGNSVVETDLNEKRQAPALAPPGTPEARESTAGILHGLASGIQGTNYVGSGVVAGILNGVGGGFDAAASLPPAPSVANGRPA
ncbi:hypothetical protein E2P81_ATG04428 [Venturia nashicola]|uniref:Uncharacterized protein n=1 Tax=Venturia nashicola TaxID=86259 RepID=A0A4Z1P875_9PEZI|nr:hypothetical protein E6O75_ATG04532 [Venturia nashicola]TLD37616.1 hypothetical protein E2P81_ATG04428 [Venturia nashicola]